MSKLFLSILNMSLTASYVIIFIMLIRLPLKKAPKFISYVLWGVAAFRLIIPFSFESMFSLMPRNTNAISIPRDIIYQQSPQVSSGIEMVDSFVNQLLPIPAAGASVNPLQIYIEIGAYIWILGIVALLVYSFVSIFILKKQLKSSRLIEGNIYEATNLKTPFVLGVIKPNIYLPAGLKNEERDYILLHEQTHIHRKDHIIKILAFFILSIHWFNPLVWMAFILMSRDMELSCDEQVLKEMNEDVKKPYANSLLSLATGRHILNSSPLAFSEGNVKGRIKNVMNYKKPTFWVVVITMILALVVTIGLVSNPISIAEIFDDSESYAVSEKWAEALKNRDGKVRYELMAPESKADYYDSLIEINGDIEYPWVIGWSSPYVASYDIKISDASAIITYITKTMSEPDDEYIYKEQLFFINKEGKTFVSKYSAGNDIDNVIDASADKQNDSNIDVKYLWPVTGYNHITAAYGNYMHPVKQEMMFNNGIDIPAPEGTPVLTAAKGTVAEIGDNETDGNYVILNHGGGIQTFYSKLFGFAEGLAEGDTVQQGDVIGYVGSTGEATGPHLHLRLIIDGEYTDPTSAFASEDWSDDWVRRPGV